ncbi:Phytocyanin domain containing protein [Trema orientale]|uniref:Phytocyanin domain containing protein n=1 Tax=Trema orientale TaxID=63057 RepID=A0A2P5CNE5_TREOI|nr:Phytocyanin domain containing protein [Trema orientale]
MASERFVILAIAVILLPTVAIAMEYIVGDDKGWTTNFDYDTWAKDKMFNVGDTLVFRYDPKVDDVVKVDGAAFKDCVAPSGGDVLTSGNDNVVLKSPGNKWYISSKSGHCAMGQKLKISVMDMSAPEPSPNAAVRGNIFAGFQVFVTLFVLLMAVNY